jgi:hypothetical protein
MKLSNEATQWMIEFIIEIPHSKGLIHQIGKTEKAAIVITITPRSIMTLNNGNTNRLVTKNNPGN